MVFKYLLYSPIFWVLGASARRFIWGKQKFRVVLNAVVSLMKESKGDVQSLCCCGSPYSCLVTLSLPTRAQTCNVCNVRGSHGEHFIHVLRGGIKSNTCTKVRVLGFWGFGLNVGFARIIPLGRSISVSGGPQNYQLI